MIEQPDKLETKRDVWDLTEFNEWFKKRCEQLGCTEDEYWERHYWDTDTKESYEKRNKGNS